MQGFVVDVRAPNTAPRTKKTANGSAAPLTPRIYPSGARGSGGGRDGGGNGDGRGDNDGGGAEAGRGTPQEYARCPRR